MIEELWGVRYQCARVKFACIRIKWTKLSPQKLDPIGQKKSEWLQRKSSELAHPMSCSGCFPAKQAPRSHHS